MNKVFVTAQHNISEKKIDESGKTWYKFLVSENNIDPAGDKIHQNGILTNRYLANPVVLYNHDYSQTIGISVLDFTENQLIGWAWFDEITEISKQAKLQIEAGTLNAASIGLQILESSERVPTAEEKIAIQNMPYIKRITDITKSELIEWSVVTIPMNPKTLIQRGLEKGIDNIDIDLMIKNYGEDMPDTTHKAGATLSKTNLSKLQDIAKLANEVIESAKPKDDDDDFEMKSLESENVELKKQLSAKELEYNDLKMLNSNLITKIKEYENEKKLNNLLKGI
jgi:hypothetical protein